MKKVVNINKILTSLEGDGAFEKVASAESKTRVVLSSEDSSRVREMVDYVLNSEESTPMQKEAAVKYEEGIKDMLMQKLSSSISLTESEQVERFVKLGAAFVRGMKLAEENPAAPLSDIVEKANALSQEVPAEGAAAPADISSAVANGEGITPDPAAQVADAVTESLSTKLKETAEEVGALKSELAASTQAATPPEVPAAPVAPAVPAAPATQIPPAAPVEDELAQAYQASQSKTAADVSSIASEIVSTVPKDEVEDVLPDISKDEIAATVVDKIKGSGTLSSLVASGDTDLAVKEVEKAVTSDMESPEGDGKAPETAIGDDSEEDVAEALEDAADVSTKADGVLNGAEELPEEEIAESEVAKGTPDLSSVVAAGSSENAKDSVSDEAAKEVLETAPEEGGVNDIPADIPINNIPSDVPEEVVEESSDNIMKKIISKVQEGS